MQAPWAQEAAHLAPRGHPHVGDRSVGARSRFEGERAVESERRAIVAWANTSQRTAWWGAKKPRTRAKALY